MVFRKRRLLHHKECATQAATVTFVVARTTSAAVSLRCPKATIQHIDRTILDVIEPQWLQDTLSDDEVEIPLEIDIPHDDADIDAGESEAARKEESKWTDLDLDTFRPRE